MVKDGIQEPKGFFRYHADGIGSRGATTDMKMTTAIVMLEKGISARSVAERTRM